MLPYNGQIMTETTAQRHRYFIYIAYDGAAYHGWQIQPNGSSIQETVANAISTILREKTEITGAGRTDTGVNATAMPAHFDTQTGIASPDRFTEKLNRLLPKDISVLKTIETRPDAHARFDAVSRTYRYHITSRRDPFCGRYKYMLSYALDFSKMNEAAAMLIGKKDFTSFSRLHTDVKTNICDISHAKWEQNGEHDWTFTITADRFLRNMVRAIVGTLIDVGRGKTGLEQFRQIIEKKDRCSAGSSVPGNALFLCEVTYDKDIFL